jgi:streptogramin lyase
MLLVCASPAVAADPEFFNMPAGYGAGAGIAPTPDGGTVWFPANLAASTPTPSLGRLIVSQASAGTSNGMAVFPTPTQQGTSCCGNQVRSVAYDATNNRVWFVQSDGIVGWADPVQVSPGTSAGIVDTLVTTALNGGGSFHPDLWDIAIGAGGLAWFTEHSSTNVLPRPGGRIGSIDGGLGVTESQGIALQNGGTFDGSRYDSKPAGITTDPSGSPWFAEAEPGLPGYRIARGNGTGYSEYLITPCAPTGACSGSNTGTGPTDVAVAHDGSIWFTNQLKNEVGRLDTAAGTFTHYSLPAIDSGLANGEARAITTAQDGTLWVAEFGGVANATANAIVKIVPTQPTPTAEVFHLGSGRAPLAVAPDAAGNVWFSVSTTTTGIVGRLAGVVGPASGGPGGGGSGGGNPLTPVSVGIARVGSVSSDGRSVTVDQRCVGPPADPCSLVYIISTHEYVTGFPGSRGASASAAPKKKKRKKPKAVILGKKAVTMHGGERRKITIQLNAKGRKLVKKKGRLKLYFTATQKGATGKAKRIKATRVTFKLKRR